MKKFLVILTILVIICSLVACTTNQGNTPSNNTPPVKTQLSQPQGLKVNVNALISWNAVDGATSYELTLNGESYTVNTTSYQADKMLDYTVSVVAKADGYIDSEPATTKFESIWKDDKPVIKDPVDVVLGIEGASHINSNETLQLKANVSGTDNNKVKWEIVEGNEYVSIDENGLINAVEVTGDKFIRVKCTSDADKNVSATKLLVLRARTELTQEMLDEIAGQEVISFVGYLNIHLYTIGLSPKLTRTITYTFETAMDGENWYAKYENTDLNQVLYFKNCDGYANQVGLSLMNDELYSPMIDEDNNKVLWDDAGLYNNFVGLKKSDFTFDEKEWRWVYTGKNLDLNNKMIASSTPYDFDPINFSLLIEHGNIVGIHSTAKDDYTIATNHNAIKEIFLGIAYGKTVEVPKIARYSSESIHEDLNTAIENMRSLDSYKLTYKETVTNLYAGGGVTRAGYYEYVTNDGCHFEPFSFIYNLRQEEIIIPEKNASYGYKKLGDNFYNAYFENFDGTFSPSRAYEKSFDNAKPSFAFAGEIFRSYLIDENDGTVTYYVDDLMNSVATTLYYGVGNDVQLYGVFATRYENGYTTYTPYVSVKDGYIVEAGFYFYLGPIYGHIVIAYSDFNETEIPTAKDITFERRDVPTSWSELSVIINDSDEGGDKEENALEFFKTLFANENIEEDLPFFGDALGDTFAFAMTTYHVASDKKTYRAVNLYYDVPLDIDYTINSSMNAVKDLLLSQGFVKNSGGEFVRGNVSVLLVDSDLDFFIYVWKN